ncbi:MAG: GAP family protein [Dermatophilaceae bacterium]
MDLVTLAGLAGLALADSTSFGTLGIPLVMLVHPRVRAGLVVLHLAVLAGFYWLLGLVLLVAADRVAALLADLGESLDGNRTVDVVQLVVGAGMLAGSFWPDTRWAKRRAAERAARGDGRRTSMRERIAGDRATARAVVAVALLAGVVEAASMLPYLGAVGLITASGLSMPVAAGILAGYVLVMSLPALVLLGARVALAARVAPLLQRLDAWMTRSTSGAVWWVVGIVGFVVAADAAGRLLR